MSWFGMWARGPRVAYCGPAFHGEHPWKSACHGPHAHAGRQQQEQNAQDQQAYTQGDSAFNTFGVRRPLRFMAHKLGLNEQQIGELAAILEDIKLERAQAELDERKTVFAFTELLQNESFDTEKAKEIAEQRVKSAERLRDAVVKTLDRTHKILTPDQRKLLIYLLRSGALTI